MLSRFREMERQHGSLVRAMRREMAEMPDERLLPIVFDELTKLLKMKGEPKYTRIAHRPGTMPQYHVGHKELVASIESRVEKLPGLELAGNAYHGVGIPDCIHTGETATQRLIERIEDR